MRSLSLQPNQQNPKNTRRKRNTFSLKAQIQINHPNLHPQKYCNVLELPGQNEDSYRFSEIAGQDTAIQLPLKASESKSYTILRASYC